MARTLRITLGKRWYGKRKGSLEPVFGQIERVREFARFLLRGVEKVGGGWSLICGGHNLLGPWGVKCAGGAAKRALEQGFALSAAR